MKKLILIIGMLLLTHSTFSQLDSCSDTIRNHYFESENYINKLNVLEEEFSKRKRINGDCLKMMVFDIVEYTGIESSISFGFEGPFYKSKELFLEDIEKWRKYIEAKCK